ncbi:MAG: 2-keto-4-pentenoate hydratase [Acidobacteriaceae bacterium]
MLTGERKDQLLKSVELLLQARRTAKPIAHLPAEWTPTSMEEVYFMQDTIAGHFGEPGGWKIGAPDPQATPIYAPMPAEWMASSGTTLGGPMRRFRGLEAEIAFLLGSDLPPRDTPYSREEVVAAIASCHPVIEELETAFEDPKTCGRFSMMADMQMHGGFVYGPAAQNWQALNFATESVTLTVDGAVRVQATGSNTSGTDLVRLVVWLANEGASRTGGLKAGDWVTTGSWTGNTLAAAGSRVEVGFSNAGKVSLQFA